MASWLYGLMVSCKVTSDKLDTAFLDGYYWITFELQLYQNFVSHSSSTILTSWIFLIAFFLFSLHLVQKQASQMSQHPILPPSAVLMFSFFNFLPDKSYNHQIREL